MTLTALEWTTCIAIAVVFTFALRAFIDKRIEASRHRQDEQASNSEAGLW